jgi:hypothetical protein
MDEALLETGTYARRGVSCRSRIPMMINLVMLQPVVALIAGILILMIPRLLNVIVGIYLILVGVIGLWPSFSQHFMQ